MAFGHGPFGAMVASSPYLNNIPALSRKHIYILVIGDEMCSYLVGICNRKWKCVTIYEIIIVFKVFMATLRYFMATLR